MSVTAYQPYGGTPASDIAMGSGTREEGGWGPRRRWATRRGFRCQRRQQRRQWQRRRQVMWGEEKYDGADDNNMEIGSMGGNRRDERIRSPRNCAA